MTDVAVELELPPRTDDLEEAKGHLARFGIARVAGALTTGEIVALKGRLS